MTLLVYYAPEHERRTAWNDPTIGIQRPIDGEPLLSAKDRQGKSLAQRGISHDPYQLLPTHHFPGNQLPCRPSHVPAALSKSFVKSAGVSTAA